MAKKKKKPIAVKSRKQKGRKFQRWIADKLADMIGIKVEKDGDLDVRPMGQQGTDVIIRGEAKEYFPLSIEAKFQENWSIHQFIKQAKANLQKGDIWILFLKRSNEKPVVVLDAQDFLDLYEENLRWRHPNQE